MAAIQHDARRDRRVTRPTDTERATMREYEDPKGIKALLAFWQKLNNDWAFQLAGMLAYNILTSLVPILIVLIAIAAITLGNVSPEAYNQLVTKIAGALPSTGSSGGTAQFVDAALTRFTKSGGVLLVIGVVTAIISGSRLFIAIENAFGIIFRLRSRAVIQQNIMAIGMMLLYAVLVPIVFLAGIVPNAIATALYPSGSGGLRGFAISVAGVVAGLLVGGVLFLAIYVVVPNRRVSFKSAWPGTVVGAVLLVVYELVFPWYQRTFVKPDSYGSFAGFAILILIFFYYLAFILLLGAEVNSWMEGQRQTEGSLNAILHEVQAHNTTRGVAGPTAGTPREDIAHHKGAAAMQDVPHAVRHERDDHHYDMKPSPVAEAGQDAPAAARPRSPEEAGATRAALRDSGVKDEKTLDEITPTSDGRQGDRNGRHGQDDPHDGDRPRAATPPEHHAARPKPAKPPKRSDAVPAQGSPVVGGVAAAVLGAVMYALGRRRTQLPA